MYYRARTPFKEAPFLGKKPHGEADLGLPFLNLVERDSSFNEFVSGCEQAGLFCVNLHFQKRTKSNR